MRLATGRLVRSVVGLLAAIGLGLSLSSGSASAQSPDPLTPARPAPPVIAPAVENVAPPSGASTPHTLTAEDLGRWLDGMMPYALERGDVPGAVVVVVKDGRPLFERGYGYADVKARRLVDPATTLFRPGSISKTFTWTAVMQLVQAGKIDLDKDINAYLDFRIPAAFGRPVTMRNLMTHSAGFSDIEKGLIVEDPAQAVSLRESLVRAIPTRIYPPGVKPAYSNWGAALAGYIVQRVSGEAFPEYVARHIFGPLGMTHASFEQPLPPGLAADMARGYVRASAPPRSFEYVPSSPAGALAASGDDMARWMIAHLQDGVFQGQRILDARTAQEMHSPQFRPIPGQPAMDLGFYQTPPAARRVIAHMGDTELFHSDMHLFLDEGVGLFISMNGSGGDAATYAIRKALYQGFLDRYFPTAPPSLPTWPSAVQDGRTLAGYYISTLRSGGGWLWFGQYLLGQAKVAADKDGVLTVSSIRGLADQPLRWRETGSFQYQEIGGVHRLSAVVRGGRPLLLAADDFPPVEALEPTPPLMSASWNIPLFEATLAVLFAAVATWGVGALSRLWYRSPSALSGRDAWLFRGTRLACLADLTFLLAWVVLLQSISNHIGLLSSRTDLVIHLIQIVGFLGVIGLLVSLANAGTILAQSRRSLGAKVSSVVLALACCASTWFALSLHLLHWNLTY